MLIDRVFGLPAHIPCLCVLFVSMSSWSGCSMVDRAIRPDWETDFQTAERRQKQGGRAMVICYSNTPPGRPDPMAAAVGTDAVIDATEDAIRCKLYQNHEPDRRYLAQFGVDRAPALVMVHRDGTYHARTGLLTSDEVLAFLTSNSGSGSTPDYNHHIHRKARYDWHDDLADATEASESSNRPMLVVYHKWHGRDWSDLEDALSRHEVYTRTSDMVHCRRRVLWGEARDELDRWGINELPAIVLVPASGSPRVLQLPLSYEAIVRFIEAEDEALAARSPS